MRLGRIAADNQYRLTVVDVIIGIGHGTIAPGVSNTGHSGRMTNARLMVYVISAP